MNNIIYEVSKKKTNILGLWQDKDKKIYRDYISFYYPKSFPDFTSKIDLMFLQGEKCIFTVSKDKAFVISQENYPVTLTKRIVLYRDKLSFNEIKDLLNKYNGITIFWDNSDNEIENFKIVIWQE